MWVAWLFVGYLLLAVAIPLAWTLVPVWRAARAARIVRCPEGSKPVTVRLDPWYATKMHMLGDRGRRVQDCTEWPGRASCDRGCLVQLGALK